MPAGFMVRITSPHGTKAYSKPEIELAVMVAFYLGIERLLLVIEPEGAL